jgi:hypothetical protein
VPTKCFEIVALPNGNTTTASIQEQIHYIWQSRGTCIHMCEVVFLEFKFLEPSCIAFLFQSNLSAT